MDKGVKEEREKKNSCIQCGKELDESKSPILETKIGGQVFKVCDSECEKKLREQTAEERKDRKEQAFTDIKIYEREIAYKKVQLEGKVIEKNHSVLYNTRSFPKDDLKPKFVLETEIERLNELKEISRKIIKNIKELEEEDANT